MMRLLESTLATASGVYTAFGSPFDGYAYKTEADRVVERVRIVGGFVISDEPWDDVSARVLFDALDEVDPGDEPTYWSYMGEPFDGVAFEFASPKGFLMAETRYERGWPAAGTTWFENGVTATEFGRVRRDGSTEDEHFFEHGGRKSLFAPKVHVTYDEYGEMTSLLVHPGYDELDLERLDLKVASDLMLLGSGVDDALVDRLLGKDRVCSLYLRGTSLTCDVLGRFGNGMVNRLATSENPGLTDESIRSFVAAQRQCDWVNVDGV